MGAWSKLRLVYNRHGASLGLHLTSSLGGIVTFCAYKLELPVTALVSRWETILLS